MLTQLQQLGQAFHLTSDDIENQLSEEVYRGKL